MAGERGILSRFRLDGKCAIVTGVSSGLGIAFSEALAEAGADLVVCARREEQLRMNASEIASATGRKVVPVAADVSKEEDIIRVIKTAEQNFGKVDIMIPSAGTAATAPSTDMKKEDWDRVIATNLTGVFLSCRHAIRSMVEHKVGGSVINIASIYGLNGDMFPVAPYYAAKGAIVNMTRALAVEFCKQNIRVNAIAPGFFPSEMTTAVLQDPQILKYIEGKTPLGRLGRPDELKGAVVFLASDASSYVTGQTIPVDGGWTAW
ncbi:MAG: glucose 1-dehydrogenase [Candidatus Micrarchaeota archaeon]|nr:glucose 1-dehydrogenase [Candidatus Micrarchaeota archaeon]